jgi:DNA polymerase III epsilon subunit-like protein
MTASHELYVSVDVETAGPIPGKYSLLSIGACDAYNQERVFSCQLKPLNKNAVVKALKVSNLSLEKLQADGLVPEVAMRSFADWLASLAGETRKIVFVGLNAPFDWSFVNYYFHMFLGENPFGFTALDIKALYMGVTGCEWSATTSNKMSARLKPARHGNHDALQDAIFQAELFRLIRETVVR